MKKILSREELEKLSTSRLIAYKKSLPYPRKNYNTDSLDKYELDRFNNENDKRAKNIQEVKNILLKREHIKRKK